MQDLSLNDLSEIMRKLSTYILRVPAPRGDDRSARAMDLRRMTNLARSWQDALSAANRPKK